MVLLVRLTQFFKTICYIVVYAFLFFLWCPAKSQTSQQKYISLTEAVNQMLTNNPHAKNARLNVEMSRATEGSAFEFHPTEFTYYYGQVNSALHDSYFEVNQNFGSPLAHYYMGKINGKQLEHSKTQCQVSINELTLYVKSAWFEWIFAQNKLALVEAELLEYENSFSGAFPDSIPAGNDVLFLTMLQTKYADVQNRKFQAGEDYKLATNQMKQLLFTTENIAPADTTLEMYAISTRTAGPDKFYPATHIRLYDETLNLRKLETNYERSKFFPEIVGGYFNQQIATVKGLQGVMVGISLPLWFLPQKTKVKQATIQQNIAQNELDYQKFSLEIKIENLKIQLDQLFVQISFYSENALKQAEMLEQSVASQYKANAITINEFFIEIGSVYSTRLQFLEIVKKYNQVAVELEFLVN